MSNIKIDINNLDKYFDFVAGATMDSSRVKKGDVIAYALKESGCSAEDAVMIGDKMHDILGAKENGLASIGVLFGYGSREELENAGADYIKTSTGFGTGGATIEDVKLFKEHIGPEVKIKAAGGVSSIEDLRAFLELGCDRIGTSRAIGLCKGLLTEGY